MSLYLIHHYRIERLEVALAENLATAWRTGRDPFVPAVVVVPQPTLATWLRLRLSDRLGILANVRFTYLENALHELLAAHCPGTPPVLLPPLALRMRLLTLLLSLRHHEAPDELAPFSTYLESGGPKAVPQRAWQLAGRLCTLLLEYEYHRPDLVEAWRKAPRDAEADPLVLAQRAAYLAIFKDTSLASADEPLELTLPALFSRAAPALASSSPAAPVQRLHLFAFSSFSPLHGTMLQALAGPHELYLYHLNPSREYWEDLRTQRGRRRTDLAPEEAQPSNLLLSRWGRPGRQTVRLLADLEYSVPEAASEGPWDEEPEEPPPTLLGRLQHGVVELREDWIYPGADGSLTVLACPGLHREVEVIHQALLRLLDTDPSLDLSECGVVVPDLARYLPIMRSVFEGSEHPLPLAFCDGYPGRGTDFAEAVCAFLVLARGPRRRAEVNRFLDNPWVQHGFKLNNEGMARQLEALLDELEIHHDHYLRTVEPSTPAPYSWLQGLRRCRLGRLTAPPNGPAFTDYLPQALDVPEGEALRETLALLAAFFSDLDSLAEAPPGGAGFAAWLRAVLPRWLHSPPEAEREATESLDRFLADLDLLVELDRLLASRGLDPGRDLEPTLLDLLVSSLLEEPAPRRGRLLHGGLAVGSPATLRPLPFRILFVLGLEEGSFPRRTERGSLDLRRSASRDTDLDRREVDEFHLLELLLGARERLFLSYVCLDPERDESRPPGQSLSVLLDYLKAKAATAGETYDILRPPVVDRSRSYLMPPTTGPAELLVQYGSVPRLQALQTLPVPPPGLDALLASRLKDFSLPPALPVYPSLRGTDLHRFLLDPAAAWLRFHLGKGVFRMAEREQDEDLEALALPYPELLDLFSRLVTWKFSADQVGDREPRTLVEDCLREAAARSKLQPGALGALERERLFELTDHLLSCLDAATPELEALGRATYHRTVVLGVPLQPPVGPLHLLPALSLHPAAPPLCTELEHVLLAPGLAVLVRPTLRRSTSASELPLCKHLCRAYVDGCLLTAALGGPTVLRLVLMLLNGPRSIRPYDLYAYDLLPSDATEYLASLVGHLLAPRPHDLPHEVIRNLSFTLDGPLAGPVGEDDSARYHRRLAERLAVREELDPAETALPVPLPEDALDLVLERFLPMTRVVRSTTEADGFPEVAFPVSSSAQQEAT